MKALLWLHVVDSLIRFTAISLTDLSAAYQAVSKPQQVTVQHDSNWKTSLFPVVEF